MLTFLRWQFLRKSLAENAENISECHGEAIPLSLIITLNLIQCHYQGDNINLMSGLNKHNICLESFVGHQIPVYPIHYVERIDPQTSVIPWFSWFTIALNLPSAVHKMIKCCISILLSNQWLAPYKALKPGRTDNNTKPFRLTIQLTSIILA